MDLRLNRFLAQAGVSSRRRADQLVREGRVEVNSVPVTSLGMRIDPAVDRVTVDGAPVSLVTRIFWGALHKPAGVLTTLEDPFGRPDLRGLLDGVPERVFPVGRLDEDSEGLLLFTNDGDLAHRLTHPRYQVEKEYEVEAGGDASASAIARLLDGVELTDGVARAVRVHAIRKIAGGAVLRIVLTEGRNREVRRMMGAVGLGVRRLARIRVGTIELGNLRAGEWRQLTAEEIASLRRLVGLGAA